MITKIVKHAICLSILFSGSLKAQQLKVENFKDYDLPGIGIVLSRDTTFGQFKYEFVRQDSATRGYVGVAATKGIDGYLQVGGYTDLNQFKIKNKFGSPYSFSGFMGSMLYGGEPCNISVVGYENNVQVTDAIPIMVENPNPVFYPFFNLPGFDQIDEVRFSNDQKVEFRIEHWSYSIECDSVFSDAGEDFEICTPHTALTATVPEDGIGEWTVLKGSASIADVNSPGTSIFNLDVGENIFQWEVSNSCSSAATIVKVFRTAPPVQASAGGDINTCHNNVSLDANYAADGEGIWIIISGSGIIADQHDPKSDVSGFSPGLNTLIWTIQHGCSITSDTVYINYEEATVDAGDVQNVNIGQNVMIGPNNIDKDGQYHWTPELGLDNANMPNPLANPSDTTLYTLTYMNHDGCVAKDSMLVYPENSSVETDNHADYFEKAVFEIPTGFSPNGDGINDSWEIKGIDDYPKNLIRIFNRWGSLVYEQENYSDNNSFTGIANKNSSLGFSELPAGTYFYQAYFKGGLNNQKSLTGYLILNR